MTEYNWKTWPGNDAETRTVQKDYGGGSNVLFEGRAPVLGANEWAGGWWIEKSIYSGSDLVTQFRFVGPSVTWQGRASLIPQKTGSGLGSITVNQIIANPAIYYDATAPVFGSISVAAPGALSANKLKARTVFGQVSMSLIKNTMSQEVPPTVWIIGHGASYAALPVNQIAAKAFKFVYVPPLSGAVSVAATAIGEVV